MADVVRLLSSSHSVCFSSSSSIFTANVNSVPPPYNSFSYNSYSDNKRVCPLICSSFSGSDYAPRFTSTPRKQVFESFKVHATIAETDQPKWWEKSAGPNMSDIHSTEEFLSALSQAGDRLVIVEFYGTWCASCRALYPKLCKTAVEHPEIVFLKVNFDENKPMCKSLNVKVLPYFHFYRGAYGQLESFSCSLAKFQKIKDAIALHNTAPSSSGPPKEIGELTLESVSTPTEKPT